MNAPVRRNAKLLETVVILEKFSEIREGITDMINAERRRRISTGTVWAKHLHVREREAVMFVIVSQKGEGGILVLDCCSEDCFIPINHFVKASGHVNNVGQFARGCHRLNSFRCLIPQLRFGQNNAVRVNNLRRKHKRVGVPRSVGCVRLSWANYACR